MAGGRVAVEINARCRLHHAAKLHEVHRLGLKVVLGVLAEDGEVVAVEKQVVCCHPCPSRRLEALAKATTAGESGQCKSGCAEKRPQTQTSPESGAFTTVDPLSF